MPLSMSRAPPMPKEVIVRVIGVMQFSGGKSRGNLYALHRIIASPIAVTYVCVRHFAASCGSRCLRGSGERHAT